MYVIGEHQADIEHIRVLLVLIIYIVGLFHMKFYLYIILFYSKDQGRWVKPDNIDWYNGIKNQQPIVYVAKGSHANYNKPGTWYRIFGFANDKTMKNNAIMLETRNSYKFKFM